MNQDFNNDKPYYIVDALENKKNRKNSKLIFILFYVFVGLVIALSIYLFRIDKYEFYLDNTNILLDIGSTYQIKSTPKHAEYFDVTNYEYKSENPSIATVTDGGTITSIDKGVTNIIVKLKNSFYRKKIKVTSDKIDVNSLQINVTENLEVDENSTIVTNANGQDNTRVNVKYESNNESVLKVDEYGNVSAIKEGTATITATSSNGVTTKKNVTVNPSTDLEEIVSTIGESDINKESYVEPERESPEAETENNIIDNPVPEDNEPQEKEIPVTDIKINTTSIILNIGDKFQLKSIISPSNASNLTTVWTSNNKSIATVDNSGNVTAVSAGNTAIKVSSSNGKTAICDVIVKSKVVPTPTPTPTVGPTAEKIHFIKVLNDNESYKNVTNGAAILLESNGKFAMIDTGRNTGYAVLNYLKKVGVTQLEFIIFTHSHWDHTGGVRTLKSIKVNRIYMKNYDKVKSNDVDYEAWNEIKKWGAPITHIDEMSSGTVILGDMNLTILNRKNYLASNQTKYDNNNSALIYLVANGHKALFTGDYTTKSVLQEIINEKKPLDVYTLGHHGYQGSSLKIYSTYVVCPNSRYQIESKEEQLSLFKKYIWNGKTFGDTYKNQVNKNFFFSNDRNVVFDFTNSTIKVS